VRALVRRSLFDSLQTDLEGGAWLDLFAGSGSFGIEALSRGAAHATFVEAGREGIRCLRDTLGRLGLAPPEAVLLTARIPDLLMRPPPTGSGPFDFVSLDPPFAVMRDGDELRRLVSGLAEAGRQGWFRPGCLLAWEEPADAAEPVPEGFSVADLRGYGTSRVRRLRFGG
jgi:16S rRNA (guanine966-N2)-methyltransferase